MLGRKTSAQVWMIESPEKAGLGTLAGQADLAVSFCRGGMDPSAANDGLAPERNQPAETAQASWVTS